MKFDTKDPRITAYALGETPSETDQQFIQSIENEPEFQALVEEIQGAGNALAELFAGEPNLAEPIEADEILEEAAAVDKPKDNVISFARPARILIGASGAVAAVFLLNVFLNIDINSPDADRELRPIALSPPPPIGFEEPTPQKTNLGFEKQPQPESPSLSSLSASISVEGNQIADLEKSPRLNALSDHITLGATPTQPRDSRKRSLEAPPAELSAIEFTNSSLNYDTVAQEIRTGEEARSMEKVSADMMVASSAFAPPPPQEPFNRESYDRIEEKGFLSPTTEPLSTFSIDVDTASYANMRRFIQQGRMPPPDAVRIEELINYFDYSYPRPEKAGEDLVPFSVNTDIMSAPWAPQNHLIRIGLQGYEIPWNERPASNLVFLLDVSGSMNNRNKLGLVKRALTELIQKLDARDRVAIVTYAGSSGLALPSTTANNHATIEHALNNLRAGGSTNGGQGIKLAYKVAKEHFVEDGNNRVILCTDGDFNVGIRDRGQLTRLIEEKAQSGVFLSICGFGMGNYQDGAMEELSNKGNGNYVYIDSFQEAQKVFGKDLTGTLITIAKDVKIQIEFNPATVAAYRLIGYENRALANEDFNDDTKDAGEIGAGHSVTALYEIVPVGVEPNKPLPTVDALKYQTLPVEPMVAAAPELNQELLTVKLRYKQPDGDTSKLISQVVNIEQIGQPVSDDFAFISALAEFSLLMRGSELAPQANWKSLIERAKSSVANNPSSERSEFLDLAKKAAVLDLEP